MANKNKPGVSFELKKGALQNAVYFAGRRLARRARGRNAFSEAGTIVLVDMDFTLLDADSMEEVFKQAMGKEKGLKEFNRLFSLVVSGKESVEEAMLEGFEAMIKNGFSKKDAKALVDRLVKSGRVRKEVVNEAMALKRMGKRVVIATKMSETVAEILAKRLGFDFGIGTRERIDKSGKVLKIEELVGDRNGFVNSRKGRPYAVVTKLKRVEDKFREKHLPFSRKQVTILTDSMSDIRARREAAHGILFVPAGEKRHHKAARLLRLADTAVFEGPGFGAQLKKALENPHFGWPRHDPRKKRKRPR